LSRLVAVLCAALLSTTACAEESTTKERSNVTPPAGDGGSNEASTTDAGTPDPEDGRDTDPASCFAACSNASFTCTPGSLVANVTPDAAGCTGTIGPATGATQILKVDCGAKKVCIDDTCADGRYSATTFAYTPSGGTQVVCTRD
jgi:hypothetical protein